MVSRKVANSEGSTPPLKMASSSHFPFLKSEVMLSRPNLLTTTQYIMNYVTTDFSWSAANAMATSTKMLLILPYLPWYIMPIIT